MNSEQHGSHLPAYNQSSILTLTRFWRRHFTRKPAEAPQLQCTIRLRNVHCVTQNHRPRDTLSHRTAQQTRWHACCLYPLKDKFREGRANGITEESVGPKTPDSSAATTSTLNNNEKTLLHTQASDRHPAPGGVFLRVKKERRLLRCASAVRIGQSVRVGRRKT